ncbi:MAG: hypothetical protein A2505_01705 [Deltaproteobacteria bacterium RIFOXYD12_FULL_55_16]|nr:MAG: hypothetical protein A2505_01705 [Deltaproteobacteria bacterium RIFOXYD12_FULL_55_16]
MRCPKCGYISFDRQKSCGKCGNDLTAVAEQLQGTVSKHAVPFFLGSILGEQKAYEAESGASFNEAEEFLILDEQEVQILPANTDDFALVEAPQTEIALEDQTVPVFALENVDASDLAPLQPEREKPTLSMDQETEAENLVAQESRPDELELELATPRVKGKDKDNMAYSSLIDSEKTAGMPEENEEIHDIFELFLEDGEKASVSAEGAKKPVSAGPDIPDLGLTLEKDEQ